MTLVIPDAAFMRFCVKVIARAYCFGALRQKDALQVCIWLAEYWPWYIE